MGLSAERTLTVQDGGKYRYVDMTASLIYRGDFVAIDTLAPVDQGFARTMTATQSDVCLGIALETVDNTDGTNGSRGIWVMTRGVVLLPIFVIEPLPGETAYWATGATVNQSGNSIVGKSVRRHPGGTDVWVELRPYADALPP